MFLLDDVFAVFADICRLSSSVLQISESRDRESIVQLSPYIGLRAAKDRKLLQDSPRPPIEISGILNRRTAVRPVRPLRSRKPRIPESKFLGNCLGTWEFHPST